MMGTRVSVKVLFATLLLMAGSASPGFAEPGSDAESTVTVPYVDVTVEMDDLVVRGAVIDAGVADVDGTPEPIAQSDVAGSVLVRSGVDALLISLTGVLLLGVGTALVLRSRRGWAGV